MHMLVKQPFISYVKIWFIIQLMVNHLYMDEPSGSSYSCGTICIKFDSSLAVIKITLILDANLGGGFKYFLFSPLLGEIIQSD